MCGINFILSRTEDSLEESIRSMQEANRFRGPDASDFAIHKKLNWQMAMGVNRLKVIDADNTSNQPMVSSCGNYILAFNGEVYNYQDLKNQLLNKYNFNTRSDTELTLYWLQEFGVSGLRDLKGAFSIVFVNLKEQRIIFARDRHGITPLYYCKSGYNIIVSSTIPAIENSGKVELSLNNDAIDDYLAFRHVVGNKTFYNEINSLNPGEIISVDHQHNIKFSSIPDTEKSDNRSLKEILVDSVSLIYSSDQRPGLLLSGGVDSTLLLAILNKEMGVREISTYTLNTGTDARWARKAAKQFGTHHLEIEASPGHLDRIDEFLDQTDQPIGDHGAFAMWLVAEQARKNSNVLLSGAGADELFGGYNRHRAYHYYLKHNKLLLLVQKIIGKAGLSNLLPGSISKFTKSLSAEPQTTYSNFLQNYSVKKLSQSGNLWDKQHSLIDNLEFALDYDRKNYLVNDVLAISDNSTMQHAVETRVPYLYDDIVDYAKTIPVEKKMSNKGKGPLKDLLKGYGGAPYSKRGKMGFGLPMGIWLRDKQHQRLWDSLNKDNPVYEFVPEVKIFEMLRLHQQGKKEYHMQLWSILVMAKWFERKL